ncbi:TPA: 5'-nucleotidase, lipoprotein e(P4) family [Clostridium perfringens]|uniref:5'-nucleotidase, lipoprotein e(P4) family n=1 Tax=Clostridium perfringens TaxID=1502 RepID=UPI001009A78F|nr:5'-nucleotidase, lipoprotein e(P4) family [Clostridium perfringens]EJT5940232.1 5'-nucleotidase, lipoprotein e(P4) family [Clostridium perfringens]EJT6472358.1 5'-nucleotidase, lipoprotein e(P4) family [Clostridium perfringens]RXI79497.1 5'-nucleotidase, lipoprotein e(P4) family [Clostridium perfringens]RXI80879.1 5'-nucleotidase, lipoprotein e(P4) family [Clostridium perfringens]RXI82465.1 5'-nucleotidase, lipoprotein e(P4) family [Clostridium perfringens]
MKNSKIIAIVLSAIIGIGVGTGGTLVYENNQEAKQISKLEQTTKANAVEEIVKGNVLATLWQQNSGEVKALRYEAYNSGKRYVDELVKEPTAKPYAVTLDIDETIIDNSPHAGYEIKHNELYSKENFGEWVQMADAAAIDGAKDFTDYAKSKGFEVFYVSNRSEEKELDATIKNMQKLGFVNSDKDHILLKTDTSSKDGRWNKIKDNYNLAIYCGDNLGDFPDRYDNKSNEQRREIVDKEAQFFGTKYIVLPNPTYGDFENAVYGYDFKKSPEQKLEDRLNSIKSFK